jgi:hypothetical protein
VTFPGAVPRSFIPPTLLGLATLPLSTLGVAVGVIRTKLQVQILSTSYICLTSSDQNWRSRTNRQTPRTPNHTMLTDYQSDLSLLESMSTASITS